MQKEETKIFFPISRDYQLAQTKEEFVIERRWMNSLFKTLMVFSVIWNMLAMALIVTILLTPQSPSFFYIFPVFMLLFGLPAFYYALCGYLNKTTMMINSYIFIMRTKPLWWGSPLKLALGKIEEFFIVKKKNRGKVIYDLKLHQKNNKEITLIQNIEDLESLTMVMEKMNKRLNLV